MTPNVDFLPAATVAEAVARIYGLTGAQANGRGEKRALVALRDSLRLDVDVVRTNAVLGAAIADTLGIEWTASRYTHKNYVNLDGLNALLLGATMAFRRGELRKVLPATESSLADPQWSTFNPAISKIEAVTRIAALTGAPPESLGPGSKERKSVLENFADRVFGAETLDRTSKTRLARDLAGRLDVSWPDTAYSTGETISLEGLNLILAGGERRLGRLGSRTADLLLSPAAEAGALVAALHDGFGDESWEATACIRWLHANGLRGAFDNEWQGFYFEARGREILNTAFVPSTRPPRARYGNTAFDYALNFVWDLKAHTARQRFPISGHVRDSAREAPLNDVEAMRHCVAAGGLGFLVLDGTAVMDEDGSFVEWHRAYKATNGIKSQRSNSGKSRTRKAAFEPLRLDAVWIPDTPALDAAVASGRIKLFTQGRQAPQAGAASGTPRGAKYMLMPKGRADLAVASVVCAPRRVELAAPLTPRVPQERLW